MTDDDDPPELALQVSAAMIDEDGGTSEVSVRSTNGTSFPDDKTFTLVLAGTATETDDYTISGKTLTLEAGETRSDTVTVTGVTDAVADDNETIGITIADYTHITDSQSYSVDGAEITIGANTAPTVSSAEVAAATPKQLVITFDEPLDTTAAPAASAFTVKVGGTAEPQPTAVSISGSAVTLTLAVALDASQSNVTVDYTNPGTSNDPLKDASDNEVASFANRAVTNNAPACPAGQPGDAFWTACLTVEVNSALIPSAMGYFVNNYGVLSDTSVPTSGGALTVDSLIIQLPSLQKHLIFIGNNNAPQSVAGHWVLQVGDNIFALSDASYSAGDSRWSWNDNREWTGISIGDKVSVSLRQGNRPPTASNGTVDMDEDGTYTFAAADFGYSDPDSDPLASVKIVTVETAGSLQLSGADLSANDVIAAADIGNLVFTPAADGTGSPYASFTFKVNDGTVDSADTYTMAINVLNTPDVLDTAGFR